jgi:tetratricopeptide (TPR) repeat protein
MAPSICLRCGEGAPSGVRICGGCCDELSRESPLWTMDWGTAGKGSARRLGSGNALIFLAHPSHSGQTSASNSGRFDPPDRDGMPGMGQARYAEFLAAASGAMALAGVPLDPKTPLPRISQADLAWMSSALDRLEHGFELSYSPPSARVCLQFAGLRWRARPGEALAAVLDKEWLASSNSRNIAGAMDLVDSALAIDPMEPEALRAKVFLLQETGRAGEASKYSEALAETEEPTPETWVERGVALAKANNHPDALRCYERALALEPDLPDAWVFKGDSLFAIGRYREADRCYGVALGKRPADKSIAKKRADTLAKLGEIEKATAIYPEKRAPATEKKAERVVQAERPPQPISEAMHEPALALDAWKMQSPQPSLISGEPHKKPAAEQANARSIADILSGLTEPATAVEDTESLPELDAGKRPAPIAPVVEVAVEADKPDPPFAEPVAPRITEPRQMAPYPAETEPAKPAKPLPEPPASKSDDADSERIETEIDEVLSAAPDSRIEKLLDRADMLLEEDEFEEALATCEEVLAISPGNEEAVAGKCKALSGIGRSDDAIALLDKWLPKTPESLIILEAKGDVLAGIGKFYSAVEAYDAALAQDHEDKILWNKKGEVLLGLKKFEESLSAFNEAVELDERYADAWLGIGDSFFGLGKFDEAYKCFDKALELDEDLSEAWYKKGTVLEAKGRWGGALQLYERAIALDPEYFEPRLRVAEALSERQKYNEALKAYDEVLSRKPTEPKAMAGKASTYRAMGRWGAALQLLENLTKEHDDFAPGWILRGQILKDQRQSDKAMTDFDRALAIEPENSEALIEKSWLLFENGGFNESLRIFKIAAQVEPRNPKAWLGVAESFREMGDKEKSMAAYDKAIEIAPGDSAIWLKRGIALHEFERYREALDSYDKALGIIPNLEEAKRWRERSSKRLDEGGAA